ncbi:tripartite tricarboxylate transporter substrate binding protein [Ramlibacter sp. AW1]|uniref:Tripartite tricarboxylate transporter substrate binding protein n=1 Tax=Ramlibacter aurantiacus TaxID=2801330 RepID=A0A936ZSJ0_9BURK|nr:tripartite tricarboxylate transporter substrate-binding protein [Ramlibacter aurantiacus]MBL0422896.1 tripartite tricarboxylate transporter substrate binding protein [Ramlibacter aurantiacus]
MHIPRLTRLAGIAAFALTTGLAAAQSYPSKPVRFITASTGSPQDVVGRIFAQKLGETWGQPVVVDNRAGAGSLLSIQAAAKSAPDGYNVLVSSTAYAVTPYLYRNTGYDAEKDLIPVALLATAPNILVTTPNSGIRTLKDAVDRVKAGQTVRYGSPGFGTTPQLSADYLFKVLARTEVTHVPYKGIPPLMQGVLSGEVEIGSAALPPAVPLIKSGRLVGLAVTSARRSAAVPNVPTIAEAGFTGFEDDSWVGIWVPAGTPQPVIARLREELGAVAAAPDVKEKLANVGFEAGTMSGDAFSALVQKELRKWDRVVKETGTKVE